MSLLRLVSVALHSSQRCNKHVVADISSISIVEVLMFEDSDNDMKKL